MLNKMQNSNQPTKAVETNPEQNKKALWGLILSIISIFGVGLAGIVGMVLGLLALTEIKHMGQSGRGMAISAIIIGFIWGVFLGIARQFV